MAPAPQSEHTAYGRSCTVCAHSDLGDIDAALVANASVSQLAQQFSLGRDSLYRHVKWHLRPAIRRALPSVPSVRPVALVERLARIADDARDAAAAAYASGNAHLGARLGDAERRALIDLAQRFGIDHDSVSADRAKVAQLARALDAALSESPALAALMADALDAEGARDMADALRPTHSETKEVLS